MSQKSDPSPNRPGGKQPGRADPDPERRHNPDRGQAGPGKEPPVDDPADDEVDEDRPELAPGGGTEPRERQEQPRRK